MTPPDTEEPKRADLCPTVATYRCPVCERGDEIELAEADDGFWSVPAHERYRRCDDCDTFIDIGWNGWRWHEADRPRQSHKDDSAALGSNHTA
jgi:hypothetical protein